jgi:glycosyltransferase involved in cell wall biosynthesis
MKILQLSTFDVRFGAAIAARRLHEALLAAGQSCDFLVNEVQSDSPRTHAAFGGFGKLRAKGRQFLDQWPVRFYSRVPWQIFSSSWTGSPIGGAIGKLQPDVVHLHWCQSGFVPTRTLPHLPYPLIWTFHDMWAFTGGCHYTSGCERYLQHCGQCPVLNSSKDDDLSQRLWWQKHRAYRRLARSLQVICPSNWMAGLARRAPLLEGIPVHVLPNPINTRTFQPIDRTTARRLLGLPTEGRLLLMGAAATPDRRKGFDLLDASLREYAGTPGSEPLGLVTLGKRHQGASSDVKGLTNWNIGFLQDEVSLCALYNAVDLVALPSREENLSNMLAEALCCGIPCLAFAIGGNGDLISHQVNGYLAKPGETADMAAGLTWTLKNIGVAQQAAIAKAAHQRVSYEVLVPEFLKIYRAALALA